jgi:flagellar capping protein FliD
MSVKQDETDSGRDLFSAWIKTTGDLWGNMFQIWSRAAAAAKPPTESPQDASGLGRSSMDAAMQTWQILSSTLSRPETIESMFKGAGTVPEILVRMAQNSLTGFLEFQHKVFERMGRIGKSTEAYTFEDLDENAFRAWIEIYEKEFRQFFNIPQLGLARFYQEKFNRALDKYNLLQAAMGEFLRLLYLPVSKSYSVMQERLGKSAEAGELPEDSKAYYQMWIKILEGHYMTLFQSPDYLKTLRNVLDAMSEFSVVKNDLMQDMLSALPVTTQKDTDDLYKEIYLLKKRIKVLEKKLDQ